MADLPFVIRKLSESIRKLSGQQKFTVIFFGDFDGRPTLEVPPGNLQDATTRHKNATIEWIQLDSKNVFSSGGSDPVPALRQALSYRPQLLYLLSDDIIGKEQYQLDQAKLLEEIRDANRSNTRINTIQFIYPDPLAVDGRKGTLELIAEQSGGKYLFIGNNDIDPP